MNARPGLQNNSHEALIGAACSGGGLACLACFRADRDPSLCKLATPTAAAPADVCVLVHKDSRTTPRIRAAPSVLAEAVRAVLPG